MKYKSELINSMEWLGAKENVFVLGQSVRYHGNSIYNTIETLPLNNRIELPVFEETQMGISIGMAMNGLIPISCFPRFDFILRAMDSLVNHLDKMQYMSENAFKPKVIIRTSIGSISPLDGGAQHTQNYSDMFKQILTEIDVVVLNEPEEIFPAFKSAYENEGSTLLIEWADYYNNK